MNRDVCEHFNPVDLPCAKCAEKIKSEALFLIDELESPLGTVIRSELDRRIITELRRLASVEAQRDELLEACKTLVALPGTEDWAATLRLAVEQARAAIKKAEGA